MKASEKSLKVGVAVEDVMKRVLEMPGPYTTARRVYTSFSSSCRPNVSMVQKAMENVQESGFCTYKMVNKLKVFYKVLPNNVDLEAKLSTFNIPLGEFEAIFRKVDERLTSRNIKQSWKHIPMQKVWKTTCHEMLSISKVMK